MIKKIINFLKIAFFANIGVFVGRALYEIFWYRTHPEIYIMNSAPWYTNILVYGLFTLLIAAVLGAALLVLKIVSDKKAKS